MATANRILNILMAVAALAAAVLATRLYTVRQEARARADALAAAVNGAWGHLDGGRAALDWAVFHENQDAVHQSLFRFENAARDLRDERDAQRRTVAKLRVELADTRGELAQTQQAIEETRTEFNHARGEGQRFAVTLRGIGTDLGQPLVNLEAAGIEQLQQTVIAVKLRAAQVPALLTANDELSAALKRTRAEVGLFENQLTARDGAIAALRKEVGRLELVINDLRLKPPPPGLPDGAIVMVNYDYHFAIIDLGRRQSLPVGLELVVSRAGEYICDLQVSRVYENYAVAEIVPGRAVGLAVPGDSVAFLPPVLPAR